MKNCLGNTIFFCSSQKLPNLGPILAFFSWHDALQGPLNLTSCVAPRTTEKPGYYQVWCRGSRKPSRTTVENLDCVNVKNAAVFVLSKSGARPPLQPPPCPLVSPWHEYVHATAWLATRNSNGEHTFMQTVVAGIGCNRKALDVVFQFCHQKQQPHNSIKVFIKTTEPWNHSISLSSTS